MRFLIFFVFFFILFLQGCSRTMMVGTTLLITKFVTDSRSINEQINDSYIEKFINMEINKKIGIKNSVRIVSAVYNGKILLMGQVPISNLEKSIQDIIFNVYKDHCIFNFIRCEKPISYIEIFQDYLITLKIYLNLLIDGKIEISNAKIFTENKEIFIFKETNKKNEKNILEIIKIIKNMKKVYKYFCI